MLAVSRRLGHGPPVVTLTTYADLFSRTDVTAASAIEAALDREVNGDRRFPVPIRYEIGVIERDLTC